MEKGDIKITLENLNKMTIKKIKELCKDKKIKGYSTQKTKSLLISYILEINNNNDSIYLIDNNSLIIYCIKEISLEYQIDEINIKNKKFLLNLKQKYTTFVKKHKNIKNMYYINSCDSKKFWRKKHLSTYKKNIDIDVFIEYLKNINNNVIDIDEVESIDIISILVNFFTINNKEQQIKIISMENILSQLYIKYSNIKIYDFNYIEMFNENNEDVLEDLTYNILSIKDTLIKKQINNLDYVPRYIQDKVVEYLEKNLNGCIIPDNMKVRNVQLGLCCINTKLREKNIFCSRSLIMKNAISKGVEEIQRLSILNLVDLIYMIKYNADHGIRFFRISSDIFPHLSNPKVETYSLDFAQELLTEAGKLARKFKQRLTFHPGQFNVISTQKEDVFEKTCIELGYHAEILDRMGCDQDSVIVVHGGGIYNNKKDTIERLIKNFYRLPTNVQRRLVIENCEKSYNVEDCLYICEKINIPMIFDTHHYECYNLLHENETLLPAKDYIPRILNTFNKRHIKPKFHVSTQCCDKKIGAHSGYIDIIPEYLLNIKQPIDIAVEAKMKELAIYDLYNKYPYLKP